jgi:hypothetical protein
MIFKCKVCGEESEVKGDRNRSHTRLYARPWYVDGNGLKHLIVVCLQCGGIHDCSGSFLKGLLTGFRNPLKIHDDINPFEISVLIMERLKAGESGRQIAIEEFGIPEDVIDVLVDRNILGPAFKGEGDQT